MTQATSEECDSETDPTRKLQLLMVQCELFIQQGKYEEAESLCIKCLNKMKDLLCDTHPHTLRSLNNLAGLYERQGRYEEAETLFLDSLDKRKAVLGDTHLYTITTVNNLTALYRRLSRYEEARALKT